MTDKDRKAWLHQEGARLTHYQHQHRGLSFIKLFLPPTTDRKVNLVGLDSHIYRGSIPRIPEDQLPPDVDEKSIDEEALYKEIRDMNFPPVPEQEPLGPSRRIGGAYTLAKKMTLSPVQIEYAGGLEEIMILGKDGGIYKAAAKYPSRIELEKKLRGTKRPLQKIRQTSSSRGFVEPSLVSLQTSSKPLSYRKSKKGQRSLIELPTTNLVKISELVKSKDTDEKNMGQTESRKDENKRSEKDKAVPQDAERFEESEKSELTEKTDTEVSDTEISEEADTEISEADTEVSEEADTEVSEEADTEVPEEADTAVSEEADTEVPEEADTAVSEADTEISVEADTEVSVEADTEVPEEADTAISEAGTEVSEEADTAVSEEADTDKLEEKSTEESEKVDTEESEKVDTEESEKTGTDELKETATGE